MHSTCNLKYNVPKKILAAFHNGSNYDTHFIIKELAGEFKKKFTCWEENTAKYITFTVQIEKEVTIIDKNGEVITKNISCILQFSNSARFRASLLSNLFNNLSEEIHKVKCKYGHEDKKCETWTRIKSVLPFRISSNQTAYVKNRFINKSGRLITDILEIANILTLEGFLITIDSSVIILLFTASYRKFFKNLDAVEKFLVGLKRF